MLPVMASSSAASFPRRNECPVTYYSLKEQEKIVPARKFEAKGKPEEKRSGRLVGVSETSKKLASLSRNLNILALPKRRECAQCRNESSWQVRQSRLCREKK